MTAPLVLSAASYRRMPWRNGGGITTEIAVHPPGSGPDAFDWRASVAEVASDGPFSSFAGVDRILVLLSGGGVRLNDGRAFSAELRDRFRSIRFDGALGVHCELLDGPVRDFNLMLRRGRARGSVTIVHGGERGTFSRSRTLLCHAASGSCRCGGVRGELLTIQAGDTLLLDPIAECDRLGVQPCTRDGAALVAEIEVA